MNRSHLFLKLNNNDVDMGGAVQSLSRAKSAEVYEFDYSCITARDAATGNAMGRNTHLPVRTVISWGKACPLIFTALVRNQVAEAHVKHYAHTADGNEGEIGSIHFTAGRVASLKIIGENTLNPALANAPLLVEVTFVFGEISLIHKDGNVEGHASWNNQT